MNIDELKVGQTVRMKQPCSGHDEHDDEHKLPAGTMGAIDHMDKFAGAQGQSVTIVFAVDRDAHGNHARSFINCFDETDGDWDDIFEVVDLAQTNTPPGP